ncbi:unnamed protein product [Heligmosomoides polygyrus]|uniref:GT23 domain-containing protein n=1 Tax=Heligmosomoides polygyrus TaxID=6339 RepID=A0A183GHD6_HELPZ|nr:unnamed protein product [Heligmosomoides polygyrus]
MSEKEAAVISRVRLLTVTTVDETWKKATDAIRHAARSELGITKPGRRKVDKQAWLWTDDMKAKVREKKLHYHVFLGEKNAKMFSEYFEEVLNPLMTCLRQRKAPVNGPLIFLHAAYSMESANSRIAAPILDPVKGKFPSEIQSKLHDLEFQLGEEFDIVAVIASGLTNLLAHYGIPTSPQYHHVQAGPYNIFDVASRQHDYDATCHHVSAADSSQESHESEDLLFAHFAQILQRDPEVEAPIFRQLVEELNQFREVAVEPDVEVLSGAVDLNVAQRRAHRALVRRRDPKVTLYRMDDLKLQYANVPPGERQLLALVQKLTVALNSVSVFSIAHLGAHDYVQIDANLRSDFYCGIRFNFTWEIYIPQ